MRSTDLIILTGVLTLINSVLLGLNITFTFAINNTVDRIESYLLELLIKEGNENND